MANVEAIVTDADVHAGAGEIQIPGRLDLDVASRKMLVGEIPLSRPSRSWGVLVKVRIVGNERKSPVQGAPVRIRRRDGRVGSKPGQALKGCPLARRPQNINSLEGLDCLGQSHPVGGADSLNA